MATLLFDWSPVPAQVLLDRVSAVAPGLQHIALLPPHPAFPRLRFVAAFSIAHPPTALAERRLVLWLGGCIASEEVDGVLRQASEHLTQGELFLAELPDFSSPA